MFFVSDHNLIQLNVDMDSEDSYLRSCQQEITSYQLPNYTKSP